MKRILIIEDDTANNVLIKEALQKRGFECHAAYSGTEALLLKPESFDVIILDLMLPGLSGEDLLKKIKEKEHVPVLVLSAKDSLDSKLELLTSGSDDYMTKPFNLEELAARVSILVNRYEKPKKGEILQFKDLQLNLQHYRGFLKGHELILTKSEFKILELLLRHPKQVFTKKDIYEVALDDFYMVGEKTINVHISNIRKKIKEVTEEEYIETVWGIGFRLCTKK